MFGLTLRLFPAALCLAAVVVVVMASPATAQLRIVTYNTNTFGTEAGGSSVRTVRPQADTVLQAIGEENVNGIARPADVILLQEQQNPATTTQDLVDRLNSIYADQGITYARGQEVASTVVPDSNQAGVIRQSVVYRTDTVQLINEDSFGDLSGGTVSQPRETVLHQFRLRGYGPDSDLFIFNSHFEAGDSNEDLAGRETEAREIRRYIDDNGLGDRNVIVAGDLNVDSNFESSGEQTFNGQSALEILAADGSGRVLDPLFPNGERVDFQIFSPGVPNSPNGVDLGAQLTQSPSRGAGPLVGGGIDDRFDFILQSDELLDQEGVASIDGSLRAFGNNGSTGNQAIDEGNTIQIDGLQSFTTAQVLDALEAASDHLPVVTDFQIPAILDAMLLSSVPEVLQQGEQASILLGISNVADVLTPIGADELDFQLSTLGALIATGPTAGTDLALGGIFSTQLLLDTSQIGFLTGEILVTSDSPGVPLGQIAIPVSFQVVAAVPEPSFLGMMLLVTARLLTRRRRPVA